MRGHVTSPLVSVPLPSPTEGRAGHWIAANVHGVDTVARRSPLQPQVAARLAMGCLNDKWNYQS